MENTFDKYLPLDIWALILEKLSDNDCYYIIGRWKLIENACEYSTNNKFYNILEWAHGDGSF